MTTGTRMPANCLVSSLIFATTWPTLTPSGPSAEPSGGAGRRLAAFDEDAHFIRHSSDLPFQHADVVAADRDRDRHDRLDELHGDLLLGLVDLLDACLLALERPADELDDRALHEPFDRDLRDEERLDLLEGRLPLHQTAGLADPLEHLADALEAHPLGEDVAAQRAAGRAARRRRPASPRSGRAGCRRPRARSRGRS